jgi:hypothetical protein
VSIHAYKDHMSLAEVSSPRPATARVLVERTLGGTLIISSTLDSEESTIQMLDEAMEAIDGQRLPPTGA